MALIRTIWNDGQAIDTPDQQRSPDIAAGADDRVYETVLSTTVTTSPATNHNNAQVIPLSVESSSLNPRILVIPSQLNGQEGFLKMFPVNIMIGDPANTKKIKLSATYLGAGLFSTQAVANVSINNRIDLLYATVSRKVPIDIADTQGEGFCGIGQVDAAPGALQARKIKAVSSGTISTQDVNVYDVPSIALTLLPGTPAGSPVAPSLPSDSSTAFNVALAHIAIPAGYTLGTSIPQSSVTQVWAAGSIPEHRAHHTRFGAEGLDYLSRLGFGQAVHGVLHNTGIGTHDLDLKADWRNRFVRVHICRATADSGQYKEPASIAVPGGSYGTGGGFTGDGSNVAVNLTVSGQNITFDASSGDLHLNFATAPDDATNGDYWYVEVYGTDRFE